MKVQMALVDSMVVLARIADGEGPIGSKKENETLADNVHEHKARKENRARMFLGQLSQAG
jgi:hypothetical protein